MENFATLILLISMIGFFTGIIGLIKGKINFLKIRTRKGSGLFILSMFLLFFIGGLMLPSEPDSGSIDTNEKNIEENLAGKQEKTSSENVTKEKTDKVPIAKKDGKSNTETGKESPGSSGDNVKTPSKNITGTTHSDGKLSVHFVDVGQGQAQVIVTPNKKVMVIDGGNNDDEDDMVAYLNKLGIDRVDILIGTHPDADHVGGIDAVINSFDIGKIYMPKVQRDTQTFESVLQSLQSKGLKVTTAKAGLTLDLDPSVSVKMIAPIGTDSDANEMSAVVRIQYKDHSFLLTGDAGVDTEGKIIQSGFSLKSTVLLAAHHGSKHSTSKEFLQHVKPKHSVIQVGKNSYGHPDPEVLQRLTDAGSKIYRNDTDGTIVFTTDGQNMEVNKNAWGYTGIGTKPSPRIPSPGLKQENKVSGPILVSASIDDAAPSQNERIAVTVYVKDQNHKPVKGAKVSLDLHYKSKNTLYEGVTNSNGIAILEFNIGRAAKGYTVKGEITVNAAGKTGTAATSFTPK